MRVIGLKIRADRSPKVTNATGRVRNPHCTGKGGYVKSSSAAEKEARYSADHLDHGRSSLAREQCDLDARDALLPNSNSSDIGRDSTS